MRTSTILYSVMALASICLATPFVDISQSQLDSHLEGLESSIFPPLQAISQAIYIHPEIGGNETFCHDSTVNFFQHTKQGQWQVDTTVLKTLPTAWRIEFSHTPSHWPKGRPLPTVGFLAEFDALAGIGHACGHHLIWLQGVYGASLVRQALIDYDIPGRIITVGTPDEEQSAGKFTLDNAGVFGASQVWLMAHPTIQNAIQPMSARQNIVVQIIKDTHFEAVKAVYKILVPLRQVNSLPGQSSTAALIEDVGLFVCNVVQADIALGVVGTTLEQVNETVSAVKAGNPGYISTNFTVVADPDIRGGIQILIVGNAGHTSQNNLGALQLSIDAFQALDSLNSSFEYYLPNNATKAELDFTVDVRTRFTADLPAVVDSVLNLIPTKNFTKDVQYPAYEPDPNLGPLFIETIARPAYGSQVFPMSSIAPAAADASWVQKADVAVNANGNHTLESVERAVIHANYNVCTLPVAQCAFNHDPEFRIVSGTNFAFSQTEKTARALAFMAVSMLNDPAIMANVTGAIRAGPPPTQKRWT